MTKDKDQRFSMKQKKDLQETSPAGSANPTATQYMGYQI
jgi:hypothetical protein